MSKKSKTEKTKQAKMLKFNAAVRGEERKEHFESGKTIAQWKGVHQTHTSRKDKRRSRSIDKKKAIKDE